MNRLLPAFLLALAGHGLAPDGLDPWRGWVAFKEFARAVREEPDPGVSVQFTPGTRYRPARLLFLRQETVHEDEWMSPVGGVVCEFTFGGARPAVSTWDRWTFDHASFDLFVESVEQDPVFQELLVTRPVGSAVYWEEA